MQIIYPETTSHSRRLFYWPKSRTLGVNKLMKGEWISDGLSVCLTAARDISKSFIAHCDEHHASVPDEIYFQNISSQLAAGTFFLIGGYMANFTMIDMARTPSADSSIDFFF